MNKIIHRTAKIECIGKEVNLEDYSFNEALLIENIIDFLNDVVETANELIVELGDEKAIKNYNYGKVSGLLTALKFIDETEFEDVKPVDIWNYIGKGATKNA